MTDSGYVFDDFNDGEQHEEAANKQLNQYQTFIDEYARQLSDIEEALDSTGTLADSHMWNALIDPIKLAYEPREDISVVELLSTCSDSVLLNKVTMVFAALCKEMKDLIKTASDSYFGPLSLWGEGSDSEGVPKVRGAPVTDGEAQLRIGRSIDFFVRLNSYVTHAYRVVRCTVHQIGSLYDQDHGKMVAAFRSFDLGPLFSLLGEVFMVFITLDELIYQNTALQTEWSKYKRMVLNMKTDPERHAVDDEALRRFEKISLAIEGSLLTKRIFENCISQEFDLSESIRVVRNAGLQAGLLHACKAAFSDISPYLGGVYGEMDHSQRLVAVMALYTFYQQLYRDQTEKVLSKALWESHKKVPIVHLYGNIAIFPVEILIEACPSTLRAAGVGDMNAVKKYAKSFVAKMDGDFPKLMQSVLIQSISWMVRMESSLSQNSGVIQVLNTRMQLFLQGLKLAWKIRNLFSTSLYSHYMMDIPVKKRHVVHLMRSVELLKVIGWTFHRRSTIVAENISYLLQQLSLELQVFFQPSLVKLEMMLKKKGSDAQLDTLSALQMAVRVLNGPGTFLRQVVLSMSCGMIKSSGVVKLEDWDKIEKQLRMLSQIGHLQSLLQTATDCRDLYWWRDFLPRYLDDIYTAPHQAHRMLYVFAALQDCHDDMSSVVHLAHTDSFVHAYRQEILGALEKHIEAPLGRDIETDLRLQVHSHLDVSERNPYKTPMKDLRHFLSIRRLKVFDSIVDLSIRVTHYLDTTFYNLSTVALHDWKTYEEIRNLAYEKYGLKLTEVHLPGNTLEQGLDVLEIMRNIHVFVAQYCYNLNNQVFVERWTTGKYLNSISIRHIANSIRTHGTGILATTVNFAFQFLTSRFRLFTQFLYDDHVKSHLVKDIRFWKENQTRLNNEYPVEKAEEFIKGMKKLGTRGGLAYLDHFRILVTEIGNTLGFVRMVRSGGLHYCANAIRFVPDLRENVAFDQFVKDAALHDESSLSSDTLVKNLANLSRNFDSGTEYFKAFVQVFAAALRTEKNAHLNNFFAIVPPLMINHIDTMLKQKEKLNKKGKEAAIFTDDGFSIGVAYILKLLNLEEQMDSFHWFDSLRGHDRKQIGRVTDKLQRVGKKTREEETKTNQLTMKKLDAHKEEVDLLFYSYSGARVFFTE